jgi:hypothetical protein
LSGILPGNRKSKRAGRRTGEPRRQLQVEALEARQLLTGTWSFLPPDAPVSAENMLLLSDGTVMVHGGGGNAGKDWAKLTPDANGSYFNGTWSSIASMSLERLFFTSDVLPDGRVFVLGGEYSGPNTTNNDTNTGEIYDPVTNRWSTIANFPLAQFGDGPSEVLPDGRVLAGSIFGSQTPIYDPASDTWTTNNSLNLLNNDSSAEETWVKLPDGSILTYDIQGNNPQAAQRFDSSQNKWVAAGQSPVQLGANGGANIVNELGPAHLLPDGRVFYLGASGQTAFYTQSTNSWTAGPAIPNNLVAADAPGAMLPNGDVLFAASPAITSDAQGNANFSGPTTFFEFNPTNNQYTNVTPDTTDQAFSTGGASFTYSMQVLPTGQVLVSNDGSQLVLFTPDGSPNSSWQPTINSIRHDGGNTFTLRGTQLNGISEGANYGDDAEMASNYPIVQLSQPGPNVPLLGPTTIVTYARTSNWSSTGVATGSAPESVDFTLPAGFAPGIYNLSVVANGIASKPVLVVIGSGGNDIIDIGEDTFLGSVLDFHILFDAALSFYDPSQVAGIFVMAEGSSTLVNVDATAPGLPLYIEGGGTDSVDLGLLGGVQNIQGDVTIENPVGSTAINVRDALDTTARQVTISDYFTPPAFGDDDIYGQVSGLAPANINYEYADTRSITVQTGDGGDTVRVLATGTLTNLVGTSQTHTNTDVTVGNGGRVQDIRGTLNIEGPQSLNNVTVDDSADMTAQAFTLAVVAVHDAFDDDGDPYGAIIGLAPADIHYECADTQSLTVKTGDGGDTVNVVATCVPTNLSLAPASANAVNVQATTATLDVYSAAEDLAPNVDTINIGAGDPNNSVPGGNLDTATALVTVHGNPAVTDVNLLDQNASFVGVYTITNQSVTRLFGITGDARAGASTAFAGLNYSGLSSLTLDSESAGNTVNIASTAAGTSTVIDNGNPAISGDSGSPAQGVNIGAGTLDNIAGPVTVNGNNMDTEVALDDSESPAIPNYEIDSAGITRSGTTILDYSGLKDVTLFGTGAPGGAVSNTGLPIVPNADSFDIEGTSASDVTTIHTAPDNSITVGALSHNLDNVGHLAIVAGGGAATLTVDDQGSLNSIVQPGSTTYTLSPGDLNNLPNLTRQADYIGFDGGQPTLTTLTASIDYANVALTLNAGPRRNTIDLFAISGDTTINGGPAGDTINVFGPTFDQDHGASAPPFGLLTVNANGGKFNLDDSAAQDVPVGPFPAPGDPPSIGVSYSEPFYTLEPPGSEPTEPGESDPTMNELERTITATVTTKSTSPLGEGTNGPPNHTTTRQSFNYDTTIFYSNVSTLEIKGAPVGAGSSFDVQSIPAGTNLVIDIGNGDLGAFSGPVTVNGSGSNTAVVLDDHLATGAQNYVLGASSSTAGDYSVTRAGFGGLTYTNVGSLTLEGTSDVAGSTFDVQSTPAGTNVVLDGASTTATVDLAHGDLGSLAGPVTVNGSGSGTAVTLDDHSATGPQTYVLNASSSSPGDYSLTRANFGGLTFGNVGSLTLDVAPGTALGNYQSSTNVFVLATPAGTTTTINAAIGANNITVGLPTDPRVNTTGLPGSPLDNIQGPVTVNSDYQDNLTLWDWDSSTAQKTYAINSTNIAVTVVNSVSVANPVPISWQGNISVVALFGSAAADTYQLQSAPTDLAALVANGYYRQNTFQSLLPDRHTWLMYPNTTVTTALEPGRYAIFGEVWNFTGSPAGDDFEFFPNYGVDGKLDGVLTGNGGTLDYSQDSSPVSVSLDQQDANGWSGWADNINRGDRSMDGITGIKNIIGGKSTTLVGPNAANTWNITGLNSGSVDGFGFSGVPNLTGGRMADNFLFQPGGGVSGTIDGAGGSDSYSVPFGNLPAPLTIADSGPSTDADSLTVQAAPGTNYIVKTATQVTWGNPATETINYSGIESLTVDLSAGSNNTVIDPGNPNTTIIGGAGINNITIANTGGNGLVFQDGGGINNITIDMGNLQGPVTINGTTGTTRMTIVAPAGSNVLTLTGSQLSGAGQTINLNLGTTLANLTVDGSAGQNQLVVQGTPPGPLALTSVIVGTTTAASPSASPASFGQPLTLTANLAALISAAGMPTGSVDFFDTTTGVDLGTVALASGTASLTTADLPLGTNTITVSYGGAADFLTSSTSFTVNILSSIIVLDPAVAGALTLSGNAGIMEPGNVWVDSSNAAALRASGNASLSASSIQVVGGVSRSGNASFNPTPVNGVAALPDPLGGLAAPSGGTAQVSVNLTQGSLTINPGIYSSIRVSGNASLTLNPGIYVLAGGGITMTGNASISGSGVLIYNTGSNYPNAGGNYGGITINGNGSVTLSAATTGAYAGVVLFQSHANTRALSLGGNAELGLTGVIYAPSAAVVVSGNAQLNAALVAQRLSLSGNGVSTQTSDGSSAAQDTASAGTLLAGDLFVYVSDPAGYFTANELARIQDAINGLDVLLASYSVTISEVSDPGQANLVLDNGATSAAGSYADGVLGSYSSAGEVTIVQGWNWYDGADATQIGGGQYDFQTVVTHELGHALGLGGSADPSSVMDESLAPGIARRVMTIADLNIAEPPDGADPERAAPVAAARPYLPIVVAGPSIQDQTPGATPLQIAVGASGPVITNSSPFNSLAEEASAGSAVLRSMHPGGSPEAAVGRIALQEGTEEDPSVSLAWGQLLGGFGAYPVSRGAAPRPTAFGLTRVSAPGLSAPAQSASNREEPSAGKAAGALPEFYGNYQAESPEFSALASLAGARDPQLIDLLFGGLCAASWKVASDRGKQGTTESLRTGMV